MCVVCAVSVCVHVLCMCVHTTIKVTSIMTYDLYICQSLYGPSVGHLALYMRVVNTAHTICAVSVRAGTEVPLTYIMNAVCNKDVSGY